MALMTALGLMSGTSMDGIDAALLRTDGESRVERVASGFFPYTPALRKKLERVLEDAKNIVERGERPGIAANVECELDGLHAQAVKMLLTDNDLGATAVDVIGYHGQTILHRPGKQLTVQLGSGQALADRTGLKVVYDMRANDMANGGQGAPLVPAYHAALARSLPDGYRGLLPVAFVNIGGISNITFIGTEGAPIAFDSGPGNALIDQWVQSLGGVPYDDGGRIGSEGAVVPNVVSAYLADPYFRKAVPKSLDRNDFTLEKADGLEMADGARTLATVTAETIYAACDHLPQKPKLWVLCGGGRKNVNIFKDLERLAESDSGHVVAADDLGLNGDALEAEAWAYLAVRSLKGLPLTWPTTTGCNAPVSGGVLVSPANT